MGYGQGISPKPSRKEPDMNTTAKAPITIIPCTDENELYQRYPSDFEAQPVYIELDLRYGRLYADWAGDTSGTPAEVYYGFVRRWSIPCLTGTAANQLLDDIKPLAERIMADWAEEWNGNNMVAVLGKDAAAAEAEIEALTDLDDEDVDDAGKVHEWGLDGATNGEEVETYGITADTTDERLDEIEDEILASLAECTNGGVAVCPELGDYLTRLRAELIEQAEGEDDDQ